MTSIQARILILNITFWAVFLALWHNGISKIPFTDPTHLSHGILVLFTVGQLCALCQKWDWVDWIGTALVFLGLIGTVIGFIIAFSGVTPQSATDSNMAKTMVAVLISGMATALYTTLVGSVGALWLSLNNKLFNAQYSMA